MNDYRFIEYFRKGGYIALLDDEEHSIDGIIERFKDEVEE